MQLKAEELAFSYKNHEVLKNISFTMNSGETIAVLGKNGSGKTTLLKILLGFLKPSSGRIMIDGRNLREISCRERAERIAYIPQSSEAVYPFTVLETAVMGRAPAIGLFSKPEDEDYEKAGENLRLLGIYNLRDRSISKLSGGEKQLVLIARALTQNAELLLLDEPTSALDYSNQIMVLEKMEELRRKGYSVLFSTHNPEHAMMISSQLMLMDSGTSSIHTASDLKDGRLLSELYGRKLFISEIDTGKNRRISCLPE